jgi:NAD(P)H dehydrogenase (quinone)
MQRREKATAQLAEFHMILVTGAGGKTGKAVIKALVARGAAVRAFVRGAAHEAALRTIGVREVVAGAMDDAAALSRAVQGTAAIYHICPNVSPHEIAFATALVAAATASARPRLVYHSVLHPQIEAMPHHWNKLRVEEMLLASPLDFTILQPTAYMQNSLAEWDRMASEGIYRVPYPVATRISLVDLEDVAEAAATVLTSAGHSGATYELVGAPPLSQVEIADSFARALNRPVRAEAETIEDWDARARAAGMQEYARETLTKMFCAYARDGLKGNSNVLTWLLDRPPTSLAAFAARHAAARTGGAIS